MKKQTLHLCYENIRPFDVDDSLVMHDYPDFKGSTYVKVHDTVTDGSIRLMVNEPMVRLLKEEAMRGAYILVWSRGGHEWANAVLEALEIKKYVDLIMSKPMVYFDDKPVSEWMTDRVYIKPNVKYKVSKPTKRSNK